MPSADGSYCRPCDRLDRLRKITSAAVPEEFVLYEHHVSIKKYNLQRNCIKKHICKLSHSLVTPVIYPQSVDKLMQYSDTLLMNF